MKTRTLLVTVAILLASFNLNAEEINKWVDENGTVHFSDKAPKDKTLEVEKLAPRQAPKLGLSEAELKEQKRRTHKYQNEVKAKQQSNTKTKTRNQRQNNNASPPNIDRHQAMMACRNAYANNTKLRTACFRQIKQAPPN